MSQGAELRETARRLLKLADDLDERDRTLRYLKQQSERDADRADVEAFDRAAGVRG